MTDAYTQHGLDNTEGETIRLMKLMKTHNDAEAAYELLFIFQIESSK